MILEALKALGIEASLFGDEPTTEAEYQERVKPANGAALPPWAEVEPKLAEAQRAERLAGVRAEAKRRMIVLTGARDAAHLDILISNGNREAIRLLRKGAENWTAEEAARAAALEQFDEGIEAIRAASNALEPMDPIPADFTADNHWPEGTS